MDVSDGPAARSLCHHSGLTTLSFTTPSCLTNVVTLQLSHTHKNLRYGACTSEHEMDWSADVKEARQHGSVDGKRTAMSSTSDRISQSNSVDPRFLLRLTLHWAVSLRWREWWMDSLFILSHSKQHRREKKDLTNKQIWLFWHPVGWG